jgi:hypothetical protein
MNIRIGAPLGLALLVALAGCTGAVGTDTATTSPTASSERTASPTVQDIMDLPDFARLEPGAYFIDPDGDPSTRPRVVFEVSGEGWSQWIGAIRTSGETEGHVGVSIFTVKNIVRDGCLDHRPADPPVGPSVDDLAAALGNLAPFKVTASPTEVTTFGYHGMHLQLTVPHIPHQGRGNESGFTGCVGGKLQSWIAPTIGAFYGYSGPGYREEFWILDVEDIRLVITAEQTAGSPPDDVAEMRAILDSIQIEP